MTLTATQHLGTVFDADITRIRTGVAAVKVLLNSLMAQTGQLSRQTSRLGQTVKNGAAAVNAAANATDKLTKIQEQHGKQISKVTGGWNRLVAAMKVTAAYGTAATMIYSVTLALKKGVTEIASYDQALQNLDAIIGDVSQVQLAAMGDKMRDVARTTKFSTKEIADGMVLLAQAGFSAEESLSAISAVANLATGTLSSLQTTSDLLTTAVRAFNLEAADAGRVADVMASSINNSKLTIDKLRVAFNFVGASAAQMGLSIEEVAASLQMLANSGLRSSTMGTGLRQVLAKLIAPSRVLREEFENHHIALDAVNPSIVGFKTAMQNLTKVLYDSKKGMVDMGKAYDLFKLRGAQAAAVIVNGFASGQFKKALSNVYEVGSASKMAAKQQEGLLVKFKNLKDRAGLLAIAVGEMGLTGALHVMVDTFRDGLQIVENVVTSSVGSSIIKITALTMALKLLATTGVAVFTALKAQMGLFYASQSGFKAGMTQLSVGFALVVLRVKELIATFGIAKGALLALGGGIKLLASSFTFWLGIVATVTLGLKHLYTANIRASEAAEKSAQAHKTYADSLSNLLSILSNVADGSERYRSALVRFREENKKIAQSIADLAGVQDITTLSFEKFKAAAESVHLDETKKQINDLMISLQNLSIQARKEDNQYFFFGNVSDKTAGEIKSNINDIALAMADLAEKSDDVTIDSLLKELKEAKNLPEDVLAKIYDRAKQAQEEYNVQQQRTKEYFDKLIGPEAKNDYAQFYAGLSILDQARFGEVLATVDKEIAEYKRKSKALNHTVEQQYAAEVAIRTKAFADFVASVHKEEDTKDKSLTRRKQMYQQALVDETASLDAQIQNRKAQYTEELQIAEKTGADSVEITKKYENDITTLRGQRVEVYKAVNDKIIQLDKDLAKERLAEKEKSDQAEADQRKSSLAILLNELTQMEANGELTHAEAEKKKTKATIKEAQIVLAAAESHYTDMAKLYDMGSKQEIAAAQAVLNAKVGLFKAETTQVVNSAAEKKRQLEEETNAEKEAMADRIAVRQTEAEEAKRLLDQKLQAITLAVSKGTKTMADGAAERSVFTSQYYEKEISDAKWLYTKLRIFHWGDSDEKKAALERIRKLEKKAIDFEISEEERLFRVKQKIRSQGVEDDRAKLDQQLQAIDVLLSKGIVTEQQAADKKAKIYQAYYQDQIKKAVNYLNKLKKNEPERVDAIRDAEKKIQQLKKESTDFEIAERERAAARIRAIDAAQDALNNTKLNRAKLWAAAALEYGKTSAYAAAQFVLQTEIDMLEEKVAKARQAAEKIASNDKEAFLKAQNAKLEAEDALGAKRLEKQKLEAAEELRVATEAANKQITQINDIYSRQSQLRADRFAKETADAKQALDNQVADFLAAETKKVSAADVANADVVHIVRDANGQIIGAYNDAAKAVAAESENMAQAAADAAVKGWAGYVDIVKDANGQVIQATQQGTYDIVSIIRNADGDIVSATSTQGEKRAQVTGTALSDLTSLYDGYYQDLNVRREKFLATELTAEQIRFSQVYQATKTAQEKIKGFVESEDKKLLAIKDEHRKRSQEIYKKEIDFWANQLSRMEKEEQAMSDKILAIKQKMVDQQKTYEEKLFDLQLKNMSSLEQYQAKHSKAKQLIAEAEALAIRATEAKTFEAREKYSQMSIEKYKEAAGFVNDLSSAVKKDGQIQVSTTEAVENAREILDTTNAGIQQRYADMAKATEAEQQRNKKAQGEINDKLKKTNELLDSIISGDKKIIPLVIDVQNEQAMDGLKAKFKDLNKIIAIIDKNGINIDLKLSNFQQIKNELKQWVNKSETKTIYIKKVEKNAIGGRAGWISSGIHAVKKMAGGGRFPGQSKKDSIPVMARPGEGFVRNEALSVWDRLFGTGFFEGINAPWSGMGQKIIAAMQGMIGSPQMALATGGSIIPDYRVPVKIQTIPNLKMAVGGRVQAPAIQKLGSLNLTINNQPIGPIQGEIDVLQRLNQQIEQQARLRRNR